VQLQPARWHAAIKPHRRTRARCLRQCQPHRAAAQRINPLPHTTQSDINCVELEITQTPNLDHALLLFCPVNARQAPQAKRQFPFVPPPMPTKGLSKWAIRQATVLMAGDLD